MATRIIEFKILAFLARHPHALDSLEGISAFWLDGEDPEAVILGLERLIEVGLMQKVGTGADSLFYTNNPDLIEEIVSHANNTDFESFLELDETQRNCNG